MPGFGSPIPVPRGEVPLLQPQPHFLAAPHLGIPQTLSAAASIQHGTSMGRLQDLGFSTKKCGFTQQVIALSVDVPDC